MPDCHLDEIAEIFMLEDTLDLTQFPCLGIVVVGPDFSAGFDLFDGDRPSGGEDQRTREEAGAAQNPDHHVKSGSEESILVLEEVQERAVSTAMGIIGVFVQFSRSHFFRMMMGRMNAAIGTTIIDIEHGFNPYFRRP